MRLNAFTLALCVCLYQVRSASIKAREKIITDLDNVDLDVVEPDLIDQPNVVDIDNNLRKNIVDIPVKIIQESNIKLLDENSNDYVPNNDDSTNIKRVEIDLSDPGLPQRQEHETQNPGNYGEKEKAIFAIKQSIDETQNIFNKGLKSVSNSLKTLFAADEDLPAIQQNIQNLRQTFENRVEQLNITIRSYFKEQTKPSEAAAFDPNLEIVNSGLRNLENNFKSGVDTLTEGVEVLSIIREEDEAARAEGTPEQTGTPGASTSQPAAPNPSQIAQPVTNFLNIFQQGIVNAFDNLNTIVHSFTGNTQGSQTPVTQTQVSNPIINFIQGITGSNNGQVQKPSNQATATQAPPAGAQSDAAAVPAPAPTPAPWSPGAIFQQVQNSIQNFINPNQQQDQPQSVNNRPISQAFQNIVQFIRPGQANTQQQVPQPSTTAAAPEKAPENAVPTTSNDVPANPAPVTVNQVQAQPEQIPQVGPLQQLVQNNPVIKGIQVAVHRIQNPSADTPRNEELKPKGHHGGPGNNNNNNNNFNQGDIKSSGRIGMSPETVESLKEDIPVKYDEQIPEKIEAEEIKTPSIIDKTE